MKIDKSLLYFMFAMSFYAIAEAAALVKGIAATTIIQLGPAFHSNVQPVIIPWQSFIVGTDRYLPAFIVFILPAVFFFFLSFENMDIGIYRRTLLCYISVWVCLFAVPSLIWPAGDIYYETLESGLAELSQLGAFFLITLYLSFRWFSVYIARSNPLPR